MASPIFADVYVTPDLAFVPGSLDPLKQWCSATTCTLIHTAKSAILIDTSAVSATPLQIEQLANWVETTGRSSKKITHFLTTHAHPDHFTGFPFLAERFPGIKLVATPKVLQMVELMYRPDWTKRLTGLLSGQFDASKPLQLHTLPKSGEFELDGHTLKVYDVEPCDSSAYSFLHVPDLDLVVAGGLVYGDCFQDLARANTKQKRAKWIEAIEQIESLKPKIVVPRHKRISQIDGAYLTTSTKEYIRVFERELEKAGSVDELENRMIELYPERWNRLILEGSCQASFAEKGTE